MEQLWEQAKADHSSVYVTDLSSEAYVLHGIKFQRTEDTYVLLKGYLSDYYPEVPINYYDTLKDNGYRVGLCMYVGHGPVRGSVRQGGTTDARGGQPENRKRQEG